ncbi:NYN domain-containing protein [Micromonospora rhizosphaerae]|uniref:NYN domain-containing protein n=1 Tax=Micromonospora rhizosphaerae TaxID=568872 RepID=A0A1C6S8U2_9ACTN|nr:NYN domain-containing protein [Micromonospora rhizosphaerae]SCL25879.1 NYN domain-containing protein [Micromonospora rhizosphaerae]
MKTNTRINSELTTRSHRHGGESRRHKLALCQATGLARYRDRHQARQGAKAMLAGSHQFEGSTFACPDCRGYHLEKTYARQPINVGGAIEPAEAFTASLTSRKRRYVLLDIENPTRGARATREEAAGLWNILKLQAPGIAPHDHVVVGASRLVVRKYRAAIHGANVKWVVGADAPDGADRALLAAIDLRRVAAEYDELVIISGDHAFADLARQAKWAGLSVQVVTAEHPKQRSVLSRELAAAADTHTLVRLQPRTPKPENVTPNRRTARLSSQHVHDLPAAA